MRRSPHDRARRWCSLVLDGVPPHLVSAPLDVVQLLGHFGQRKRGLVACLRPHSRSDRMAASLAEVRLITTRQLPSGGLSLDFAGAGADESRVYDWLAAGLEVARSRPRLRGAVQTALTVCLRPAHLPLAGGPPRSNVIRCSSSPQPLHKLVKRTAHHRHFSLQVRSGTGRSTWLSAIAARWRSGS